MDILLKVYQEGKAEVKMTRINIKAFLTDIFIGSTSTTSEVIAWTITELINHPSIFNKVREEINSVVGSTRLDDESDVENLPYLQAVVKETLQLYPLLLVTTRKCCQSCEIGGFEIPQETMVLINLAGRRACPGSKLGLSMVHTAIATVVQCFNWEVVGDGGENKATVNTEVSKGTFIHINW
ncbi:hypothetical protein SO802_008223 [Lithocarpus litseifolius]|uniref:Cytochrome P450 n=1 Tax=Lithocarpus litseifolius TaxID=425828 RepID=A0AAW2DC54_9ROSI